MSRFVCYHDPNTDAAHIHTGDCPQVTGRLDYYPAATTLRAVTAQAFDNPDEQRLQANMRRITIHPCATHAGFNTTQEA